MESMELIQSWRELLLFFDRKNSSLFLWVTARSLVNAYSLLGMYFSWLIALCVAYQLFAHPSPLLSHYLWGGLVFCMALCVRPSLERKSVAYFLSYAGYLPKFFILMLPFLFLQWTAVYAVLCIPMIFFMFDDSSVTNDTLQALCGLRPYAGISVRELLREWHTLFLRTTMFILYNAPLFFLACAMSYVMMVVLVKATVWSASLVVLASVVMAPVVLCLVNNFYIKRLYDALYRYV